MHGLNTLISFISCENCIKYREINSCNGSVCQQECNSRHSLELLPEVQGANPDFLTLLEKVISGHILWSRSTSNLLEIGIQRKNKIRPSSWVCLLTQEPNLSSLTIAMNINSSLKLYLKELLIVDLSWCLFASISLFNEWPSKVALRCRQSDYNLINLNHSFKEFKICLFL